MNLNYCLIKLSIQDELASGIFLQAKAAALIMKSLMDNLTPSFSKNSFIRFLNATILSRPKSTVR